MTYIPAPDRYDGPMRYRRTGRSGLDLPVLSLGLWHNFGDDVAIETQRDIVRHAFDAGITHFDLANNYGPPYGAAELNFGRLLREDLRPYRDEIVVSTKPAGTCGRGRTGRAAARASTCWPAWTSRWPGSWPRRHLLLAPVRPGHAAGGDRDRAGHRGALGPGAVRRHLLLRRGPHP